MVRKHVAALTSFVQFNILGIVIVLFFQCMGALVSRTRGGIRWELVAHTVAMFSIVTIYNAISLNILSISYIDNREFPGVVGALPPGPIGYQYLTYTDTMNVVATVMFLLNNWLADGLLVSSVPSSVVQVSNVAAHPALSLLRRLCHEPLGNRFPVFDVPRIVGCVPESTEHHNLS